MKASLKAKKALLTINYEIHNSKFKVFETKLEAEAKHNWHFQAERKKIIGNKY